MLQDIYKIIVLETQDLGLALSIKDIAGYSQGLLRDCEQENNPGIYISYSRVVQVTHSTFVLKCH